MPRVPRHAALRHAARSRSIQKITAEQPKPGVAGLRDWRAEWQSGRADAMTQ